MNYDILEQVRVFRRRNWAKKEASPYLRNGTYAYVDAHKEIARVKISIPKYFLLRFFGRAFKVTNSSGIGTRILFSTSGGELRVISKNRIVTISHSPDRSKKLVAQRQVALPLPTPKIDRIENPYTFSEELILNDSVDYVSKGMFRKLLKKYLAYYQKLSPKERRDKRIFQHCDLHKNNILWVKSSPKFFIDLEDVKKDWYLRDLMLLMVYEAVTTKSWILLDSFFAGDFDSEFSQICGLFGEKFVQTDHLKMLEKSIFDRYHNVNLSKEPQLQRRIDITLKRYRELSHGHQRYAAFSMANERYAIYAGTALLSLQDFDPTLDFYVVGSTFSKATKTTLGRMGVQVIELPEINKLTIKSDYNIESYYYFAMPEIFLKMGYDKSICIDADVVCLSNFRDAFKSTKLFAGATQGVSYQEILRNKTPKLEANYKLKVNLSDARVHSGVLFFDNQSCQNFHFKQKMTELINSLQEIFDAPIRDNELLTIFQAIYGTEQFDILPEGYNFIELLSAKDSLPKVKFYHFTYRLPKPWARPTKRQRLWFISSPTRFGIFIRWKRYGKIYRRNLPKNF